MHDDVGGEEKRLEAAGNVVGGHGIEPWTSCL